MGRGKGEVRGRVTGREDVVERGGQVEVDYFESKIRLLLLLTRIRVPRNSSAW